MKISIVSILALATGAAAGNLRAASEDVVKTSGRFQLSGLKNLPTEGDLAVIDQVVLEAYNKIYYVADVSMAEPKSTGAVLKGDDTAMIISEFVTQGGGGCNYCPSGGYDDWECYIDPNCGRKTETISEAEFALMQQSGLHSHFEKSLCKMLRKSGNDNFTEVKDCSFSILEHPGAFDVRFSEENAYEALNGSSADVEIDMAGLAMEPSMDDLKVLESIVLDAHKAAFFQTNYDLNSIKAVSSFAMNGAIVVDARAVPVLSETSNNDADSKTLTAIHEAFEEAVCGQLQNSGRAVFAQVRDCTFRFVFNPVKETENMKTAVAATA